MNRLREIRAGRNVFLDSETCGLHGMMVLLQWAVEDGPIHLYHVWKQPVGLTLAIIELICEKNVIAFNSTFDWFHICKLYTIFQLCPPDWIPEEHIDAIAAREKAGRDGPCLKPRHTLDLMLHSRKSEYQSLMARSDIRIRRVPTVLARPLAEELAQRVEIDDIYFARYRSKDTPRWHVFDIVKDGIVNPDFKDVVLKFKPAGGLKFLAEHALGLAPKFHYEDVEPPRSVRPLEFGYAPFAAALSTRKKRWKVFKRDNGKRKLAGCAWPGVIRQHIEHWAENADAQEYARDDIVYTRGLWDHFGRPEPDDDDSILACMVAAVRWHGFTIDLGALDKLLDRAAAVVRSSPVNINKHWEVKQYLADMMDELELTALDKGTAKKHLEKIGKWIIEEREECCESGCLRCNQTGWLEPGPHPAAVRAKEVLEAKFAAKEENLLRKLKRAGRLHASFKVIGTLSSRMAGADGVNAQAINSEEKVRSIFTLAWRGMQLSLGDAESFEVTLADAEWSDPQLREDLLSGTKIHSIFAKALFPDKSYEEINASKGTKDDLYTKGKSGVFAVFYGGDAGTLSRNLSLSQEVAQNAFKWLGDRYPEMKRRRQETFDMFCSMRQPAGIGTAVIWHEPADYVESFLGFRRYFTLENRICKALFDLARRPPQHWRDCQVKVQRRDRIQTAAGAIASALYGAAFSIQSANMRAAGNHKIQSPGAQITKNLQVRVWELQPHGVNDWRVAPMQVHDELEVVHQPSLTSRVTEKIAAGVKHYTPHVPLLSVDWNEGVASWAGKSGGQGKNVKISFTNLSA